MNLPPSLMEIARIIGVGSALRLSDCAKPDHRCRRKAGYRVRVPSGHIADNHPIVQSIGREQAELLKRTFAGEVMPYPARTVRAIQRDLSIAREYQLGIPIPLLAQAHRVSERTVTRALDRVSQGDIQRAGHPPIVGSSGAGGMRV